MLREDTEARAKNVFRVPVGVIYRPHSKCSLRMCICVKAYNYILYILGCAFEFRKLLHNNITISSKIEATNNWILLALYPALYKFCNYILCTGCLKEY